MYLRRVLFFLLLNFGALAIGSIWTQSGVAGAWYTGLDKAPWTPPGWVFGAAWTLIMICLSFFMAAIVSGMHANKSSFIVVYILQWVSNVLWNFLFFHMLLPVWALVDITLLFCFVCILAFRNRKSERGASSLWLLPYIFWLCIAISLNLFIVVRN